jgi:tRNA-Thr(GGU) m(6)t(6)A37 methyltransferase TsaA
MIDKIIYEPIGVIHSPFTRKEGMPIQPKGAEEFSGTVEIFDQYADGLKDLDGFSHIFLIYHFHESKGYSLQTKPFLDDTPRGVFATRAPKRPNPVGVSVVRLNRVEMNILHIQDVDIMVGAALIDIKPFVSEIDNRLGSSSGWLNHKAVQFRVNRSDDRFA